MMQYQSNVINFKKTMQSKSNDLNLRILKKNLSEMGDQKREENLRKQNKWSDFKERRGTVVDAYIIALKKLRRSQEIVRNLAVYLMF